MLLIDTRTCSFYQLWCIWLCLYTSFMSLPTSIFGAWHENSASIGHLSCQANNGSPIVLTWWNRHINDARDMKIGWKDKRIRNKRRLINPLCGISRGKSLPAEVLSNLPMRSYAVVPPRWCSFWITPPTKWSERCRTKQAFKWNQDNHNWSASCRTLREIQSTICSHLMLMH